MPRPGAANWWSNLGKPMPGHRPATAPAPAPELKTPVAFVGHPWPHPPAPTRIPRIVHHVWPGDDVFPAAREWTRTTLGKAEFHRWRLSWMRLHPDWSFQFHRLEATGDDRLDALLARQDLSPVVKADVLRWGAVALHGGLYVDTDFEAHLSFEPLLNDEHGFFIAYEPMEMMLKAPWGSRPLHPADLPNEPDRAPSLSPALFAAAPGHPYAVAMLSALLHRIANMDPVPLNTRPELHTGPGFVKTIARDFRDITIHPTWYFHKEVAAPAGDPRYATHWWSGQQTRGGWTHQISKWRR